MEHKPIEEQKLELKELTLLPNNNHQKISCPACSTETLSENININDKIAKCNHCNVVFSFQQEIASLLNPDRIKQEILQPEGIDIFYFKDDLDITLQQPMSVIEAIWVTVLPLFAILFTFVYLLKGTVPMAVPTIFWLLSLWPIINAINIRKHKIHITINDRMLYIQRRPKKFIKDQSFMVNDIDQVYIKNVNGLLSIHMIVDNPTGQRHAKLIGGLDSISKARFLEQEIERHLGIPDRPVPEEI